jgi:hypothetical protein
MQTWKAVTEESMLPKKYVRALHAQVAFELDVFYDKRHSSSHLCRIHWPNQVFTAQVPPSKIRFLQLCIFLLPAHSTSLQATGTLLFQTVSSITDTNFDDIQDEQHR